MAAQQEGGQFPLNVDGFELDTTGTLTRARVGRADPVPHVSKRDAPPGFDPYGVGETKLHIDPHRADGCVIDTARLTEEDHARLARASGAPDALAGIYRQIADEQQARERDGMHPQAQPAPQHGQTHSAPPQHHQPQRGGTAVPDFSYILDSPQEQAAPAQPAQPAPPPQPPQHAAAPPPPGGNHVRVNFKLPGIGDLATYYHKVIRHDNLLVLVYDTSSQEGTQFFPSAGQRIACNLDGHETAMAVEAVGIQYPCGNTEHCVLMVVREEPLYGRGQ